MAEELAFRLSIEGAEQELRNIEDLRQAVRQLEENLETADFGSEAFKRAEKELKAARGELYKFDRQLEALEDPVKAAEQWVKFGEGIAGGFAAAQGAAAIFGAESENLEKMIVKAQGAVSVAMGARMLAESQLVTMMGKTRVGTLALTAAQQAQTFVTSASTVATKAFRAALVSTGIGAIAVALGVLVANWSSLVNWVRQSVSRLIELNPVLGKAAELMGKAVAVGRNLAQSLGLIKDKSDEAKKATEELTDAQIAGRKAMEEDTKRRRAEAAKLAEEARKAAAERERLRQEELGRAMDMSLELDRMFEELLAYTERSWGFDVAEQAKIATDGVITERNRLAEIDAQIFEHASQRNKEQEEQMEVIRLKDLELRQQRIESAQVALDSAGNLAGSLSMLSQAFSKEGKKNEKIQKVLAIAQIAIDTAKGISGAVAAGAGLPFPANLGAIATGVASVIAGIASAKAALSEAGGGGGGGSTPSVNLPTFAPPEVEQRTGNATTAEGEFGGGAFGPARAYVVGSDVSSDMEARQRVEDLASLGG